MKLTTPVDDVLGKRKSLSALAEKRLELLNSRKERLNPYILNLIEEQIELLSKGKFDRTSVLEFLKDKSSINSEYYQFLIDFDEAKTELKNIKSGLAKTRLEKQLHLLGLQKIQHSYTNEQLFSILLSSSLEEALALIADTEEYIVDLLEGALKANDIYIDTDKRLKAKTTDGTRVLKILSNDVVENFVKENILHDYSLDSSKIRQSKRPSELMGLLSLLGTIEDVKSLKNLVELGHLEAGIDGKFVSKNKLGAEFLESLQHDLLERIRQEYKKDLKSKIKQKKNKFIDSMSSKAKVDNRILIKKLHHPFVNDEVLEKLWRQKNREKLDFETERKRMHLVNDAFEAFTEDLSNTLANLALNLENLHDKKTLIQTIYSLEDIVNRYHEIITYLNEGVIPSLIHLEEKIKADEIQEIRAQILDGLSEEIENICERRACENQNLKKALINKKRLNSLVRNKIIQKGAVEHLAERVMLEGEFNIPAIKTLLVDIFELEEDSDLIKSDIILEAEEILREARVRLLKDNLRDVISLELHSDQENMKLQINELENNIQLLRDKFKKSLNDIKDPVYKIKMDSVRIKPKEKDLQQLLGEMHEMNNLYLEGIRDIEFELDRQHRKIAEIESNYSKRINQLATQILREKIS